MYSDVNRIELKNGFNKTVTLEANGHIESNSSSSTIVLGSGDGPQMYKNNANGQVGLIVNGEVSNKRQGDTALEFASLPFGGSETALVTATISGSAYGVRMGQGGQETLVCDGTITGEQGIVVNSTEGDTTKREVAVFSISPKNGTSLDNLACVQYNGTKNEEATQNFLSNIDYIIHTEKQDAVTLTLTGTKAVSVDADLDGTVDGVYQTANQGQTITITVTTADGYECTDISGACAVAVKQEDGTWAITMPAGGGMLLSATLKKLIQAEEKGEDRATIQVEEYKPAVTEPAPVQTQTKETLSTVTGEVTPEGAVLGATVIRMDAPEKRPQIIEELKRVVGVSFDQAEIVLHTETTDYIDDEVAGILDARRPEVSVTLFFMRNGRRYKVIVPGGKNLLHCRNANGQITFDALAKAFGAEEDVAVE